MNKHEEEEEEEEEEKKAYYDTMRMFDKLAGYKVEMEPVAAAYIYSVVFDAPFDASMSYAKMPTQENPTKYSYRYMPIDVFCSRMGVNMDELKYSIEKLLRCQLAREKLTELAERHYNMAKWRMQQDKFGE